MSKDEREIQPIGERGSQVLLCDAQVVLRIDNTERHFTPQEAMELLEWLYDHRDELYQATHNQEGTEQHGSV